jgi:Cbb3-type cytochrome oxidase, subunit 1
MWRALEPDGTLTYTFAESVKASFPYYVVRLIGGVLYLSGMVIMAYNTWRTVRGDTTAAPLPAEAEAAPAVQPVPQLNTVQQGH